MAQNRNPQDWQVMHTENQGRTTVVANMVDDADDANALCIHVSGRTHQKFAQLLAALLQQEGVSSHQA